MKKKRNFLLIAGMLAISFLFYLIDYMLFRDVRDTVFYTVLDIAFLPIQVLLVTLILERLLTRREKEEMMKKLNMVIGVFFSEAGNELIRQFARFDGNFEKMRTDLIVDSGWNDKTYWIKIRETKNLPVRVDTRGVNLLPLGDFLAGKRAFLLGLMENSNLLENESFAQLLLAVFHVTDELSLRKDPSRLSPMDQEHIANDIKRAYLLLISEWLSYMNHLRTAFPYLYSLAVRMNPFHPSASAEIRGI